MEKYYLGKLAQASAERIFSEKSYKLIEIQFSRRPPTFGLLYISQETNSQDQPINQDYYDHHEYDQITAIQQQCLLLSALTLSNDNTAKLDTLKQIQFADLFQTNSLSANQVLDFDVMGETLLIEGGSSLLNEQQLRQSMCMLLTRDGYLLLISMIDCQLKYLLNCQTTKPNLSNRVLEPFGSDNFIECYLRASDDDYNQSIHIYVLTEKSYYCFSIKSFSQFKQKGQPQQQHHSLVSHYSLSYQENWLKFLKLTPISPSSPIVMLELNDHSIRVINTRGKTVYNGPSFLEKSGAHSTLDAKQLVLTSNAADQQTIILTYCDSKITAHSLLINLEDHDNDLKESVQRDSRTDDEHMDEETKVKLMRRALDPDQLLPQEPSFELERCWSLDLNDIDSIRSLDDQDNERDSIRANDQQINGCLCPLWSSNQLNETNWPKFLLISYKYYVLVYSFEQQIVLPFSVVYDRAFLGQEQAEQQPKSILLSSDQQQTNKSAQDYQESIDLRMKPRLIHNFKLIGPQPTDLLINTLFLVSKISLMKAKQFTQLGLVVCLSGSSELFALKLTSNKIVAKKDNLYQQLVLDSIRGNSLLMDEIERLQENNNSLRDDISNLSNRTNHSIHREKHLLDNMNRMLQVSLKQQQQQEQQSNRRTGNDDGLFQLNLNWSNLIQISRIVVVCSVNSYIIDDKLSNNPILKSIHVNNYEDADENQDDPPVLMFKEGDSIHNIQEEPEEATKLNSEPIKSIALIDLHDKQENVHISVPIFLIDGHFGEIGIYFVLSAPKRIARPPARSIRSPSLILSNDMSDLNDSYSNHPALNGHLINSGNQQQQMPMKYYKKTIQIKPLVSYQYFKSAETMDFVGNSNVDKRLQINCANSQQLIRDWLHECLQEPRASTTSGQEQSQWHLYKSGFTHCHVNYKLDKMNCLVLISDDFTALETVKKHLLKRATDLSIRLDITHSVPLIGSLHHLIGRQKLTLDRTASPMFSDTSSESNKNNQEQQDILLESLLNQVNLNELPLDSTSIMPMWLERSLRRDVEGLFVGDVSRFDQMANSEKTQSRSHQTNRGSIIRDIVFSFIVDALVDYDSLHNTRTPSELMAKMRESLETLMGGRHKCELSEKQFADQILTEWNSIKRGIK